MSSSASVTDRLVDRFSRAVSYLRVSVTDRCDFRCVYCMAEKMTFLPRAQVLTLEEILFIIQAFTDLGVSKVRITGGEPLVRRNVLWLFQQTGQLTGLQELVLTTNGSQLSRYAEPLRTAGVKRINISLDTLRSERFRRLTRIGDLQKVMQGIQAAKGVGFERIKLNAVILRHRNHDEVIDLVEFALGHGLDISFIEKMPLGDAIEHERLERYYPSDVIRQDIESRYALVPTTESTGGPARYYHIPGSPSRIGFISPHSHNFCASCNRVRLTAEGRLLLCLGQEHSVDLRRVVRSHPGNKARLKQVIGEAMEIKPKGHDFDLTASPAIMRHMNLTGG
jgi:cyclic pyranopterin phosphate synthase